MSEPGPPLWVRVEGVHLDSAAVGVGPIDGSDVVLRVEPSPDGQHLVYLDVRDQNGEWRRLHRSTLTHRGAGSPPFIRKLE